MDDFAIQRKRKMLGQNLALIEVHIGHRQRAAAAVASRAGLGARAVGADDQLHAVKAADRASAGRDGFDGHHRRHDPHAGFFGFVLAFITAVESGDIRARSAHIEADRAVESGRLGDMGKTDHSARRPGEDAVFADELVGIDQPARRIENPQLALPRPSRSRAT